MTYDILVTGSSGKSRPSLGAAGQSSFEVFLRYARMSSSMISDKVLPSFAACTFICLNSSGGKVVVTFFFSIVSPSFMSLCTEYHKYSLTSSGTFVIIQAYRFTGRSN